VNILNLFSRCASLPSRFKFDSRTPEQIEQLRQKNKRKRAKLEAKRAAKRSENPEDGKANGGRKGKGGKEGGGKGGEEPTRWAKRRRKFKAKKSGGQR
jgi:hypothetical protein